MTLAQKISLCLQELTPFAVTFCNTDAGHMIHFTLPTFGLLRLDLNAGLQSHASMVNINRTLIERKFRVRRIPRKRDLRFTATRHQGRSPADKAG